jgi:hypothetical protein
LIKGFLTASIKNNKKACPKQWFALSRLSIRIRVEILAQLGRFCDCLWPFASRGELLTSPAAAAFLLLLLTLHFTLLAFHFALLPSG